LLLCLIAVKDWAKPPSDHVDPYHLGIRFVGFLTAVLTEISLLKFALLLEAICCWRRPAVVGSGAWRLCRRYRRLRIEPLGQIRSVQSPDPIELKQKEKKKRTAPRIRSLDLRFLLWSSDLSLARPALVARTALARRGPAHQPAASIARPSFARLVRSPRPRLSTEDHRPRAVASIAGSAPRSRGAHRSTGQVLVGRPIWPRALGRSRARSTPDNLCGCACAWPLLLSATGDLSAEKLFRI
jgi:hypothetical protein